MAEISGESNKAKGKPLDGVLSDPSAERSATKDKDATSVP